MLGWLQWFREKWKGWMQMRQEDATSETDFKATWVSSLPVLQASFSAGRLLWIIVLLYCVLQCSPRSSLIFYLSGLVLPYVLLSLPYFLFFPPFFFLPSASVLDQAGPCTVWTWTLSKELAEIQRDRFHPCNTQNYAEIDIFRDPESTSVWVKPAPSRINFPVQSPWE